MNTIKFIASLPDKTLVQIEISTHLSSAEDMRVYRQVEAADYCNSNGLSFFCLQ